eukprot:Nitzschia sp. Nitz4//scaffold1_size375055//328466//330279//NITZ4_000333-RA/size375055-augustus-gene-0.734-mRNA-1//-1//CDS//3329541216//5841//frame0
MKVSRDQLAMGDEDNSETPTRSGYSNRHVPRFLALPQIDDSHPWVQIIRNGPRLNSPRILENNPDLTLTKPILVYDTPESIGMKLPKTKGRPFSVRDVANILGHHYPVHVIDVEHQEELEGWTLADLVEYFEDEERLLQQHQREFQESQRRHTSKRRRKAAEKCLNQATLQRPRVLNQISLEFSKTPMRKQVQSPQFVRDIDWIDNAWPRQRDADGSLTENIDEVYPNVQYYCLTSAADCFTDFHIDFGGTAVWYHILSGEKDFCLIPPTRENLAIYEEWLCRPDQASIFLPDMIPNKQEVLRISLAASQTLIIPTAWIHAVYTPSDSLVFGGNFLHGLDMSLQLEVHCIEARTRVQEKFRFPQFIPLHFYSGGWYLTKLRSGQVVQREVDSLLELADTLREWWKVHKNGSSTAIVKAAQTAAKQNQCASVEEFLLALETETARVQKEGITPNLSKVPPIVSSAPAPTSKLRLSLKTPKQEETDKFRIVVSSSKLNAAAPTTPRSRQQREDTEWFDEGLTVEDEWTPGRGGASKKSIGRQTPTPNKTTSSGTRPKARSAAAPKAKPTASSTARQRLMKRLR